MCTSIGLIRSCSVSKSRLLSHPYNFSSPEPSETVGATPAAALVIRAYLYGHSVAALGSDDSVVSVVIDLVVVNGQEVAVVVGVEAVQSVVVHLVAPPVSLLVAVRVDPEVVVVDVRVVDVAVDVDVIENFDIA